MAMAKSNGPHFFSFFTTTWSNYGILQSPMACHYIQDRWTRHVQPVHYRAHNGALHTVPWIPIRCGLGIGFKDHFASTGPRSESELCAVLRDRERDPVKQCNACSLRAVWSSRTTTLNPDRGFISSESVFSARVKSPSVVTFANSRQHSNYTASGSSVTVLPAFNNGDYTVTVQSSTPSRWLME